MVSLYRGRIKVLTNSTTTFMDGTAIVSRRDKNQVAGLALKEHQEHQEHRRVLPPHGAN
jgi:hypothetical protein